MSDWAKKLEDKAKGLIAEAEQELTVLEGVDTVDLTTDGSEADGSEVDGSEVDGSGADGATEAPPRP